MALVMVWAVGVGGGSSLHALPQKIRLTSGKLRCGPPSLWALTTLGFGGKVRIVAAMIFPFCFPRSLILELRVRKEAKNPAGKSPPPDSRSVECEPSFIT
jgi:hypothetical protein